VFDDRIIQTKPKFMVSKGALSLTNAPFNAVAASASQHTYNIYVPSENVFVDRAVEWSSTALLRVDFINNPARLPAAGDQVLTLGQNAMLCPFPLNSSCTTISATINDTTTVINSQDVLKEVLRLADYKKSRLQRTCPTMLDRYARYSDALDEVNSPMASYASAVNSEDVPNGAYNNIVFCDSTGAPLAPGGTYTDPNGVVFDVDPSGVPLWKATGAPATVPGAGAVFLKFRSTEKLVLSPFVFADANEYDTGLFGINNIQLVMNIQNPTRLLRFHKRSVYSNVAVSWGSSNPFSDSVVNVQFLTPSLDVELPPKSVVPYMEFPRYISQPQSVAANGTVQLQSQTITLPQIPDLLLVYVKARKQTGVAEDPNAPWYGDFYLPPASYRVGGAGGANTVVRPLSINFDNFSGLLSSHTSEELYAMSVKNGLSMDWNQWSGSGYLQGGQVPLTGGFLVLRPGQDLTLQSGQAPSLVGNFTLQLNLQVKNPMDFAVDAVMTIITVNSGFFETIRGSSRIIKGVLSEADIISAPLAPVATHQAMRRLVGAGFTQSLSNILNKVRSVYEHTKPVVSAMKPMLPEKVRQVADAVGYGTGAGTGAGKKSMKGLKERLL